MKPGGGELIAGFLKQQDVGHLFTLCGGHISPILVSCKQAGIRVVDVRHEASAVFAADAVARSSGIPGVAAVTAGPGLTNAVTALKNAQLAQSPVIVFGGATATLLKNRGSLQDIDQRNLVKSAVKRVFAVKKMRDLPAALRASFQAATSGVPGPVFIECPIDLLYPESLVRQWYTQPSGAGAARNWRTRLFNLYIDRHLNRLFGGKWDMPARSETPDRSGRPGSGKLNRAAAILESAGSPVLIVGSQAMLHPRRWAELAAALETIGIPVYLTGMARGLLGRRHPLQMIHRRRHTLKQADVVLLAGMPCDFRLGYGRVIRGRATLIGINRSRRDLYLNLRPDLAVHEDPFVFLCALAAKLEKPAPAWKNWIERLHQSQQERESRIDELARSQSDEGINPLHLLQQLEMQLPENTLMVADGGDFVATAAYLYRPRSALSWLDPGVFGTLGVGAGFALGAKLMQPDKEVWLLYGDGAAGFSLQEMDTFVRHRIPVIAVIGNDGGWTQIARDQTAYLKDDVGTVLNRTEYHRVAEGYGAAGFLLDRRDRIEAVIEQARQIAAGGTPVVINALIGKSDFRKGSISM